MAHVTILDNVYIYKNSKMIDKTDSKSEKGGGRSVCTIVGTVRPGGHHDCYWLSVLGRKNSHTNN